jgi:hypothetical protein
MMKWTGHEVCRGEIGIVYKVVRSEGEISHSGDYEQQSYLMRRRVVR